MWLTFLQNAAVFKVFKNNETVDCRQTSKNKRKYQRRWKVAYTAKT